MIIYFIWFNYTFLLSKDIIFLFNIFENIMYIYIYLYICTYIIYIFTVLWIKFLNDVLKWILHWIQSRFISTYWTWSHYLSREMSLFSAVFQKGIYIYRHVNHLLRDIEYGLVLLDWWQKRSKRGTSSDRRFMSMSDVL